MGPKRTKRPTMVFGDLGERSRFLRASLENPIIAWLLIALFFATLTFLLSPSFRSKRPKLAAGEIAKKSHAVRVEFSVMRPNKEAEQQREKLTAQVPPYYEFQRDPASHAQSQIQSAFNSTRPLYQAYTSARASLKKGYGDRIRDAKRGLRDAQRQVEAAQRRKRRGSTQPDAWLLEPLQLHVEKAKLHLSFLQKRKDTDLRDLELRSEAQMRSIFLETLQIEGGLNQEDVKAFIDNGFSEQIERLLSTSILQVLRQKVVTDQHSLRQDLERGIVWRATPGGQWSERTRSVRFVTQQTARRMVDTLIRRDKSVFANVRNLERACVELARNMIRSNFEIDLAITRKKKSLVKDKVKSYVLKQFRIGEPIVRKGDTLQPWHAIAVQRHYEQLRKLGLVENPYTRLQISLAIFLFILLTMTVIYRFAKKNVHTFGRRAKDVVLIGGVLTFSVLMFSLAIVMARGLAGADLAIPPEAILFCVPVAFGAMMVRLFVNTESALIYIVLLVILVALQFRDPRSFAIQGIDIFFTTPYVLYVFISGIVGAAAIGSIKQRTQLWKASMVNSGVNIVTIFVLSLFKDSPFTLDLGKMLLGGALSGILAATLLVALTPIVEHLLKYTTDIKLLELGNLNAPIFHELLTRAPGTYHHSVIVGNLSESAAEQVGANGLLCRVAAYYHDLGKMKNPKYFAENQEKGENPHDRLKPQMSALIIKAHVKDGKEKAKELKLHDDICDVAFQHHGTSLIRYFYHRAQQQAKEGEIIAEDDFRYPGPKPQTREAGILMLADTTEAAAKSLPDPSPARLKGLVQKVINGHFTDGQLDECELTLKDLDKIAAAFIRILNGIYHVRPEYPGAKKPEPRKTVSRTDEHNSASVVETRPDAEGALPGKSADTDAPPSDAAPTDRRPTAEPGRDDKRTRDSGGNGDGRNGPATAVERTGKDGNSDAVRPATNEESLDGDRDKSAAPLPGAREGDRKSGQKSTKKAGLP